MVMMESGQVNSWLVNWYWCRHW